MNNLFTRTGIIFVLSAPSGTGKTTLCNSLRHTPDLVYSVSCTTRAPRPGEEDGVDYHFVSREEFERKIANHELLEYTQFNGNYYGTLLSEVFAAIDAGNDILLDIEINGARNIRSHPDQRIHHALADVFIMPPTLSELEHRLRKRGTETEDQIKERLKISAVEMKVWPEYKYTILSGSMEEDLIKFRAIIRAERYMSRRLELSNA